MGAEGLPGDKVDGTEGEKRRVPDPRISFARGGGPRQKGEGRAWGQLGMVPTRIWEPQQTPTEQLPCLVPGSR